MKLWRENRLDQEYELSDEEIADGFVRWLATDPEVRPRLDFALNLYIASPGGLNSVCEPADYEELLESIFEQVRPAWHAYVERLEAPA